MSTEKRRFGDRKDGKLIRDLDPMHIFMPMLYVNRCDNEAYISETFDLTKINEYIAKKNEGETDFPYTIFHVVVAAMVKCITLRPKLNRFICNKNVYQRNEVTAAFVVKKQFSDRGEEALAIIHAKPEDTFATLRTQLYEQITSCRSDKPDASTNSMNIIGKLPRPLLKAFVWVVRRLDVHGWVPSALIGSDPFYASVVLSNLGSIKLKCGYHHLTNWGTNSLFCIIGQKKKRAILQEDGGFKMAETVDLGLTIDERLADGYYYAKTIRLLRKLMENPELLERPLSEEVEY